MYRANRYKNGEHALILVILSVTMMDLLGKDSNFSRHLDTTK